MLKSFNGRTKLCNYVCAFLTLCLLILQFTPFWQIGGDSLSINGYVWMDCSNTEIASWFNSQLDTPFNINSVVITAVLVLLFSAIGTVICVIKPHVGFSALLPVAAALSGIYAFLFKPEFRLGSTWIIQLVLCIAILITAAGAIIFGIKRNGQEATGAKIYTQEDINARVAAIKALGNTGTKKGKKSKEVNNDADFYKLITYLTDEVPECRIAAAETLGKTSRDIAFTHISHLLGSEKDENVIKAMRKALISIRENIRIEHAEKA